MNDSSHLRWPFAIARISTASLLALAAGTATAQQMPRVSDGMVLLKACAVFPDCVPYIEKTGPDVGNGGVQPGSGPYRVGGVTVRSTRSADGLYRTEIKVHAKSISQDFPVLSVAVLIVVHGKPDGPGSFSYAVRTSKPLKRGQSGLAQGVVETAEQVSVFVLAPDAAVKSGAH